MINQLVQLYSSRKRSHNPERSQDRKRQNAQIFKESFEHSEEGIRNNPLQLFLEVTSKCNLRCKKCGMNYDPARLKAQKLPFHFLEQMHDFYETAVEVNTFGYGEMFLYDDLQRLVEMLKSHDCRVCGVTNGTRIKTEDVSWLVKSRYDELTFSIDGATQETMMRLRGADLNKILDVLALLKKEKRKQESDLPRIVVNFVAQKDNFRELPALVHILTDLDIFFLGVNPLHHFYGPEDEYSELYREYCLSNVSRDEVEATIEETRLLAERAGIHFVSLLDMDFEWRGSTGDANVSPVTAICSTPDVQEVQQEALPPYYCLYPWMTLYLAADMTAKVCCFMSAEENLGDCSPVSDVTGIWNGTKLAEIREDIKNGRVHPACRVCVQHGSYKSCTATLRAVGEKLEDNVNPVSTVRVQSDDYYNDRIAPAYEGCHDTANCTIIHGWVWDRNHPNRRIQTEIYEGRNRLAVVTADEFRVDLAATGKGDGKHAFTYQVPYRLKDGKSHSIRVKIAGTKLDLSFTQKRIRCSGH